MRRIAIAPSQDDRPIDGLVDADDRDLGRVDDGRRGDAAEPAEAGDRDRRSHQLVARRLVAARGLGHAADLGREVVQRARLGVLDDRHLEAVRRLRRDADVHGGMAQDQVPLRVVHGVALREPLQHAHQRGDQERQVGERRRALRLARVQVLAQRLELGDVHFLDVGEVRDVALGRAHALGDHAPHADDLDLLDALARRGSRRLRGCAAALAGDHGFEVLRRDAPAGPEPLTVARSTPASCALRRVAGDAMTRVAAAGGAGAAGRGFRSGGGDEAGPAAGVGGAAAAARRPQRRGLECDELGRRPRPSRPAGR